MDSKKTDAGSCEMQALTASLDASRSIWNSHQELYVRLVVSIPCLTPLSPNTESRKHRVIVTGGAGFIGSSLIRYLVTHGLAEVLNIDKLTYAGNLSSLKSVEADPHYHFQKVDILNAAVAQQSDHGIPPHVHHAFGCGESR